MKQIGRRVCCGILAAAAAVLLGGCSIPRVIGSVDTMLAPPRLTDDQNDIYDALTAYLSDGEMHLVYPQKGDNLSAFILCNLDADESDEAVVFYQSASTSAAVPISMAVLDQLSGGWQVVSETELEGSGVEDVTLLSADGQTLLAVGLSYAGENGSSLLDIFVLRDNTMQMLSSRAYQTKAIADLTGDGSEDLLLIYTQEDEEGQSDVTAGLFQWESDSFVQTGSCGINPEMTRYQQMSVASAAEGSKLYLDGYRGSTMITEVLSCVVREDGVQLSNTTWREETVYPQRASLVSMDADGDGVIEIPGQSMLPGFSEEDSEILYLTQWYRHNGRRFIPYYAAYVSSQLNYQFVFPDEWVGKISAYRVAGRNEVTFYRWEEGGVPADTALFSLRAVSSSDWLAGHISSDYQLVANRGQIVFLARSLDTESAEALTIEEIRERFRELG
jgi:hypothetical protein